MINDGVISISWPIFDYCYYICYHRAETACYSYHEFGYSILFYFVLIMKTFFGFQCEIGAFKDMTFNPGYIPTQSSCWKTMICSFWIVYQSKIKTGPSPHPKMDEAPRSAGLDVFVGKCIWGCKHNRRQHKQVWPRCTTDLLINGGLWRGAAEWLIELRTSSAMFWWNRREDKGLCRSAADMRVKCWGGFRWSICIGAPWVCPCGWSCAVPWRLFLTSLHWKNKKQIQTPSLHHCTHHLTLPSSKLQFIVWLLIKFNLTLP